MRLNYLFALLLAALGVGLSLLLVPRGKELALQNFRDREYELARDAYEARYRAGDRSADTVMPLVGLNLDEGEVAAAILYLEDYVAREPDQLESREILGSLYLSDERMGDYLANLEEIVRRRPNYDRVYELASYYRFFGRFDRLASALRKLVELQPDNADNTHELAELLAARSQPGEALAVLAALDDRSQGAKTPIPSRGLLTALLVQDGQVEAAFARADRWLNEQAPARDVLEMVNLLVAAGRSDLAYRLIKPYEARAAGEESLALAMVDLETVLGRLDQARLRLSGWAARGRIPDGSMGRFIGLAVNAGLSQLAFDVARDRDLRAVPDWALVGLADTAFRTDDRRFLDRMVVELGDGFLADRPVLAAEIALARGDKPAARRWAAAALADPDLPVMDHLSAVRHLTRADALAAARDAFDRLPLSGTLPDDALTELGGLFIDLQREAAGFRWFAERRRARPSAAADLGWARLCARAGQPGEVMAWLARTPRVEGWVLQDIATAANERGDDAAPLALLAAERAWALTQTDDVALLLAAAYLTNGRAAEALALVRPLLALGGAPAEFIYASALEALGLVEELAAYWTAKLATGVLTEKEADNVLFSMLANKSYAVVLPYLKARAGRSDDWLFAYVEAARGVGGDALKELEDFLDQDIDRPGLTVPQQEQRVFLLIETSDVRAAQALYRLTDQAPGRWWPLATENLSSMGRMDELAAFFEKLLARPDITLADRESMTFGLIDAGGAERALPHIARLADAVGGAWDAQYREHLTKLGRRDALRAYLTARAARPDLPDDDRRALAFALLELGDKPAAEAALLRLAAGQGPDGDDMRQLYFLWGPRPTAPALDWLEKRARDARDPAQKAAWYARLVELGGRDRVLAAIGRSGPPSDPVLLRPYAEAKAAAHDDGAVAGAVTAAAKQERSPEALRRYARLAEAARRNDAAAAAWAALLAQRPADPDALRQLGMLAYDDSRYADAERLLRRYAAGRPDDYEAHYFLGEALVLLKRPGEAAPFFRLALSQMRGKTGLPELAMQTEAALLNRLGRVDEAVAVYVRLRQARPNDRRIQADFVNMLIENHRLEEARHALAVR